MMTRGHLCLSFVLLAPALAAGPQEAKKPAAPKAAEQAKADRKDRFALTTTGDVPPSFAPTVGRLAALFYECYPKLVERFEHPAKPAPRNIRLVFERRLPYPAYCTGAEIRINVDWLEKHPDDVALLTHELTHAVQAYPRGAPGWLTEGIADYARQVYGPKSQPGWSLPRRLTERNSYRDGYRVTGRFLLWLDGKHPGAVDKVHRKLQEGGFTVAEFEAATGRSLDLLWTECVRELSTAAPQPGKADQRKGN